MLGAGYAETPIETENGSIGVARVAAADGRREDPAADGEAGVDVGDGRRIANSSPPTRNARSLRRSTDAVTRPTASSSRSPPAWPCVSLTTLRSSTSIRRSASGRSMRLDTSSWRASSSWNARWLPSPVSPSTSASCRARPYSSRSSSRSRSSESTSREIDIPSQARTGAGRTTRGGGPRSPVGGRAPAKNPRRSRRP